MKMFQVDLDLPSFRTKYDTVDFGEVEFDAATTHSVCGRALVRTLGKDAAFMNIHADSVNVQVFVCRSKWLGERTYDSFLSTVKFNDIVGIKGNPGRSVTGELTIFAIDAFVLSRQFSRSHRNPPFP